MIENETSDSGTLSIDDDLREKDYAIGCESKESVALVPLMRSRDRNTART